MTRILVALLFIIISACTEKPSGATFLSFSEAGPEGDAYPVRMLVNERFLRIEDGDARDGFIVFDRTSKTIFSVSHPDKTTLVLHSQTVKLDVPKTFTHKIERDGETPGCRREDGNPPSPVDQQRTLF